MDTITNTQCKPPSLGNKKQGARRSVLYSQREAPETFGYMEVVLVLMRWRWGRGWQVSSLAVIFFFFNFTCERASARACVRGRGRGRGSWSRLPAERAEPRLRLISPAWDQDQVHRDSSTAAEPPLPRCFPGLYSRGFCCRKMSEGLNLGAYWAFLGGSDASGLSALPIFRKSGL